jgi:Ca2+-binding EF-hand superfamily protein
LLRATQDLIGVPVLLKGGATSGKIVDLLLSPEGRVEYAVLSMQDRLAVVPWKAIAPGRERRQLSLAVTRRQLAQISFTEDRWPDFTDPRFRERLGAVFVDVEPSRPVPSTPELPPQPAPPRGEGVKLKPPSSQAVELLRLKVRDFIKDHDSDHDGKLSWKEVSALFDHYDSNHDDALDLKELEALVESLASSEKVKSEQRAISFLREYDINKDRKLSRDETRVLFDRIDRNRDKLLDQEELVQAAIPLLPARAEGVPAEPAAGEPARPEAEQPRTRPQIRALFVQLDTDGDGRISRAEVRGTALEKVFERLDQNGDGFLSREELRQGASLLPPASSAGPAAAPARQPAPSDDKAPSRPAPPTDQRPGAKERPPARPVPPADRPGPNRPPQR